MRRRLSGEGAGPFAMLALLGAGCAGESSVPDAPAWFESVEERAGVEFRHVIGPKTSYWFPEIIAGGAGFLDYDGDGFLDLYLVQGGDLESSGDDRPGNELYHNRGDGTFENVTERAGVGDRGYGMGCAAGDYDGDGDTDLYVTNVGENVLYRNEGDGTFTDATAEAGVGHAGWGTSCAFLDYDLDGDLDLFVVNYINWSMKSELSCDEGFGRDYCSPREYKRPARDVLYRNEGDGSFRDVSIEVGLDLAFGNGLGVAWADLDDDGLPDVYVANDGMPNQLWLQDSEHHFRDEALLAGCAVNRDGAAEAGMGVAFVDADGDGDLDLFMTHLRSESNTFYRNLGAGLFEDRTARVGLSAVSIGYTGFGLGFADFDGDGVLDLYVANGRVGSWSPSPSPTDPYAEPNHLFRGRAGGVFEEVLPRGGTSELLIETSRAAAFGDFDNDGAVDVAVVNRSGPLRLLRNVIGCADWVTFRVVNVRGSDALGARVAARAGGREQTRFVQATYGFQASHDPRVHYAFAGAARIDEVTVTWPGGEQERFGPFDLRAIHEIKAGTGR